MKVKVMLDTKKFKTKDAAADIKGVQYRLANNPVEIDIEDLANSISQGATFKPALLGGSKNENWMKQSIFCLDFDSGITYPEFAAKATEYDLQPNFCYNTLSHVEGVNHKCRAIFATAEPITYRRRRNA
jgi:hypothetical protein